jgi:hypothetical protein
MFVIRYLKAEKVREVEDLSRGKKLRNFLLRNGVKSVFKDTKGRE